jgi:archaemetzincin
MAATDTHGPSREARADRPVLRARSVTRGSRRAFLLGLGGGLLGLGAGSAARADERRALYLQPLGSELPAADVELVVRALRAFYGLDVRTLPRIELPAAAYYRPRQRYRADKLLDFLQPLLPADGVRILGLTAADISTTKGRVYDWGVLGLGSLDGASGVLSSYRCHKRSRGELHARQRLAKVAVHETGHTLGLDHCATDGCLMHDGEGSVLTTDTEYDLCSRCRAELTRRGHPIPPAPEIPWPRPA